jgi:starvation-inducible DNA-binding protein
MKGSELIKVPSNLNKIGLDEKVSAKLADKLNVLLANYQIFYMNLKAFHWNIKGEKFFELHVKFEEMYTDAFIKIDEIAERILTLGYTPLHTFHDYLERAKIVPNKHTTSGNKAVKAILDGFSVLIPLERELLKLSGENDDEGTNALMSDYIREQEKSVWMYSAYLMN